MPLSKNFKKSSEGFFFNKEFTKALIKANEFAAPGYFFGGVLGVLAAVGIMTTPGASASQALMYGSLAGGYFAGVAPLLINGGLMAARTAQVGVESVGKLAHKLDLI